MHINDFREWRQKRQFRQRAVTDYLPRLHGLLQQQQQPVWGWSHEWWRHSDNTSACRVYSTQWAERRTTSVALQTRPIIRAVHVRPQHAHHANEMPLVCASSDVAALTWFYDQLISARAMLWRWKKFTGVQCFFRNKRCRYAVTARTLTKITADVEQLFRSRITRS